MDNHNLYSLLTRYGSSYALNLGYRNPYRFLEEISIFENDWKKYNPRKDINRWGLSITSLDGGLSGYPDLDSLKEYNIKNGTSLTELDITKKTPVYPFVSHWLDVFGDDLARTHIIKMERGGFFPIHRDNFGYDINSFRLLIPLNNCNPSQMYFILDNKILNFEYGYVYFIDTCLEHVVLNATTDSSSYFIVVNVRLNESTVRTVVENLKIR